MQTFKRGRINFYVEQNSCFIYCFYMSVGTGGGEDASDLSVCVCLFVCVCVFVCVE